MKFCFSSKFNHQIPLFLVLCNIFALLCSTCFLFKCYAFHNCFMKIFVNNNISGKELSILVFAIQRISTCLSIINLRLSNLFQLWHCYNFGFSEILAQLRNSLDVREYVCKFQQRGSIFIRNLQIS